MKTNRVGDSENFSLDTRWAYRIFFLELNVPFRQNVPKRLTMNPLIENR